jgi:hypothetical protein
MFPIGPFLVWCYTVIPGATQLKTKLNSMAWVRERTILTERPPLVGEVGANFAD